MDYSSVKGFIIYRPYGYALWEMIQAYMDKKFKETGHENVYMPMLIPESLLKKESRSCRRVCSRVCSCYKRRIGSIRRKFSDSTNF